MIDIIADLLSSQVPEKLKHMKENTSKNDNQTINIYLRLYLYNYPKI